MNKTMSANTVLTEIEIFGPADLFAEVGLYDDEDDSVAYSDTWVPGC